MNDLEKLDALKTRMNVTYAQAKEALDQSGDDLVSALVYLEKQGFSTAAAWEEEEEACCEGGLWDKEKTDHFVRGTIEQVKGYIRQGNVTKVRIINGDKTLIEVPATIGVVGVGLMLFSPLLVAVGAVGAATAMAKSMVFEVEKSDGTVERHELKFPGFGGKKESGEAGSDGDDDCCADETSDEEK